MNGDMDRRERRDHANDAGAGGAPRPRAGGNPSAGAPRVVVRPAGPEDAAAICTAHKTAMRAKASRHYSRREIEAFVGRRKVGDYIHAMIDGGKAVFVAEFRGAVKGFSSLKDDEIMAVYSSSDAPAGTGSALLAAVEAEARARGVKRVQLMSTLNAVGFYEKKGYARGGEVDFPMAGGVRLRMVEMGKEL